jgi:hypothetical protein
VNKAQLRPPDTQETVLKEDLRALRATTRTLWATRTPTRRADNPPTSSASFASSASSHGALPVAPGICE